MLATSSILANNSTSINKTSDIDQVKRDDNLNVTTDALDLCQQNNISQKGSTIADQEQQSIVSCDQHSASFNSNNNNIVNMSSSTSHLRVSSASPPKFDAQLLQSHPSPLNYSSCSPTAAATAASVFDFDPLSSPEDSRQSLSNRNKRKNFQPRCITDEEDENESKATATATKTDEDGQSEQAVTLTDFKSSSAFDISQVEVEPSQSSLESERAKQFAELALLLKNIRQLYPQLANIPESLLIPLVANDAAVGGLLSGHETSQISTPTGSKDVANPNGLTQNCSLQEQYLRLLQQDSNIAARTTTSSDRNVPPSRNNSKGHPKEETEDDSADQMGKCCWFNIALVLYSQ